MKKLLLFFTVSQAYASGFSLTCEQAKEIGNKIWINECAGSVDGLTHWKDGEDFVSLGIGHFIWIPDKENSHFKETFPSLRWFLSRHGKTPPKAFRGNFPWKSREEFISNFNSDDMKHFRKFLVDTIDLQAAFIVKRFMNVRPKLSKHAPSTIKKNIIKQFNRVASSPNGLYALIDYVNFKGEGFSSSERYRNQGWGLLQVLAQMKGSGNNAIEEFVKCAKVVLENRVFNAPFKKKKIESSWLRGWCNRLDTYLL